MSVSHMTRWMDLTGASSWSPPNMFMKLNLEKCVFLCDGAQKKATSTGIDSFEQLFETYLADLP